MAARRHHTGTVKKTVRIAACKKRVWRKISDIAGLSWVAGVRDVAYLSERRRGVGAVRLISFENGDRIEEHVVAWKAGEHFTYVATEGLPLRAYVATISARAVSDGVTEVTWQSYMNSEKMTEGEFLEFAAFMAGFYDTSLGSLKRCLEGH